MYARHGQHVSALCHSLVKSFVPGSCLWLVMTIIRKLMLPLIEIKHNY